MNERMRFNPAEASAAGQQDAQALLLALANIEQGGSSADLLSNSLGEIIGLALENRAEECEARKAAFCAVLGPALAATRRMQPGDRVKTIHAGRTGRVVKTYFDGSACVCWDDGEPQAEGLGHERLPRHMLIDLSSTTDASRLDAAYLSGVTETEGVEL